MSLDGADAVSKTGSGGGGGAPGGLGGDGSSGIVVIRYLTPGTEHTIPLDLEYKIKKSYPSTKPLNYKIRSVPTISKNIEYKVKSDTGIALDLRYDISGSISRSKVFHLGYKIKTVNPEELDSAYLIKVSYPTNKNISYKIKSVPTIPLSCEYDVLELWTPSDLNQFNRSAFNRSVYNQSGRIVTKAIDRDLEYMIMSSPTITPDLAYLIRTITPTSLWMQYDIKLPDVVKNEMSLMYLVRVITPIERDLLYKVLSKPTIALNSEYQIISVTARSSVLDSQYLITSPQLITHDLKYKIKGEDPLLPVCVNLRCTMTYPKTILLNCEMDKPKIVSLKCTLRCGI